MRAALLAQSRLARYNAYSHREEKTSRLAHRLRHDPDALADCLVRAFGELEPGPDHELEAGAPTELTARAKAFGRAFIEFVQEVTLA